MLKIRVHTSENFDEENSEFVPGDFFDLDLEHSLVSISKWESIWEVPFLSGEEKTNEQTFSYIQCMLLSEDIPLEVLYKLSEENMRSINEYINKKMTATWFNDPFDGSSSSTETMTSELIYFWMTTFSIPFECENWHLNRLLTLIQVCSAKNSKPKKLSRGEMAAKRRALNEARKRKYKTSG